MLRCPRPGVMSLCSPILGADRMPSARQRFQSPSSGKLLALCLFLHQEGLLQYPASGMAGMQGAAAPPTRCSSISQGMLLPPPQAAPAMQGWSTHQALPL